MREYVCDPLPPPQSYYLEMDPESVSIPLRLRGKREVVFGNLLDIKTFHEEYVDQQTTCSPLPSSTN